jgi:hypothetical protein
MGFTHPGNPIRGTLVRAADPVRVDAVKPPPIPDPEELVLGGLGEDAAGPAGPPVPMTRRVRGGLGMSESVTGGGVGTFVDIGGYEN